MSVFSGFTERISYANEHIAEADQTAKAFFNTAPYEIVTEADPIHAGYDISYLQLSSPLPFRIHGLLFDAANNLKSVLDHVGFAVATAVGKTGKKAHFPFGDDAVEVESRRAAGSKHIPKEIFDLMSSFMPYKGGNDFLWWLNKLANTNKHEVTVRALLFARELIFEGDGIWLNVGPRRSGDDGRIMLSWQRSGTTSVCDRLKITAGLRLHNIGKVVCDKPAIGLLRKMSGTVQNIVSAVELESRRLGIF